jgi:hypothetical protein
MHMKENKIRESFHKKEKNWKKPIVDNIYEA